MFNNDNHGDYTDKIQKCKDYIDDLQAERRKILVFQRELPLSLQLVTQAIESCKQQLSGETSNECFQGQSECSQQTSSEGPVLEEFIPIKRTSSSDDDEQQSHKTNNGGSMNIKDCSKNNDKSSKKSDWLRSAQLWNQTSDPPIKEDTTKRVSAMGVKTTCGGGGGAFQPFKKEKSVGATTVTKEGSPVPPAAAAASSTTGTGDSSGGGNKKEDKGEQSQRKTRRCWSPELHRRFLQALQQLGGSHVATPKQIRDLMKVDGLTNDEVKSHLQKYRLHTRRPNSSSIHSSNTPQTAQFVVVGGIWMPPPADYAAMATTTTTVSGEASMAPASNGIYAPIATVPSSISEQQLKQFHPDGRGGRANSDSPTSSSSTHTSTARPAH